MSETTDTLRGELERLFELDDMKRLATELLAYDPTQLGGESGKGAFARALVERCAREDGLEALADAIVFTKPAADRRLRGLLDGQAGTELGHGTELEGFKIIKKLGEGGVGVVYLADGGPERGKAAIKVVRSTFARDRAAVRRYLTVQRALRSVNAEGLVPVLGTGQLDDGRPWVATQYMDGQTLAARVGRIGAMHINEARSVIRSILEALETLHGKGFFHGDIKAENAFLAKPNGEGGGGGMRGVLVDLGTDRLLCRRFLDATTTGALPVFGTPKAIAPEVARGEPITPQSEIYSVGSLLYEVLSGRPPFEGDSAIDVIADHLTKVPEPPSAHAQRGFISKDVDELVLKALEKRPADRYPSMRAFLEALESAGRTQRQEISTKLDKDALEKAVRALYEKADDDERAAAVERIVEPARAWKEGAEAFSEAAGKAKEMPAKLALLFRAARIYEAELKDYESAEKAYRQILEFDEGNDIAQIGIEELKRAQGDHEAVVELLLEKVEKVESDAERASILREIAHLYEEELGRPGRAFQAWVLALADEPRDQRSAREVERLGKSPEHWNEAVSALSEAVQHHDPTDAARLYAFMGRWYSDYLERPDFALQCFAEAMQLDPSFDGGYDGVIEIYRRTHSWQELVVTLMRRADASSSPAKARDCRADAAEVVMRYLGDTDRAVGMFQEVLEQDPAHPKAAEVLEAVYTDRGQWKALVDVLERRSYNQRVRAKVETLVKIGKIYEERLDDENKAMVFYSGALEHDPRHLEALQGLGRVYLRTGNYAELLVVLKAQLALMATTRQRIAVLERIGNLYMQEFVEPEKAVDAFEQIAKADSSHEGANEALTKLYRQLKRFDDMVEAIDRRAEATDDAAKKMELLVQGARVLATDVGAPDRALAFCERVLAIDPEHVETIEMVARLKANTGDATVALEAVEQLAGNEKNPEKKASLYVQAGGILAEAGDNDRAIERYKYALDAQPGNTEAAKALREIYAARGDAQGAADLLVRQIESTEGASQKARLFAELGQLYRERLHAPDKAQEAWGEALELDPTCTPAGLGAGDLAFDRGAYEEAVRHYEPLVARTGSTPQDKELATTVALRCGDAFRKLGNVERAQWAYFNARTFSPDDRDVLERVADVTFESGDPHESAELYQNLLDKFGGSLVATERGRVKYRLAESMRRAGEVEPALKMLREAAELIPEDSGPLESVAKIYEERGDWPELVRTLRRRMEHASDDERFELLVRVGDVLLDKLSDRQKASKSYVAALEVRPNDRTLLSKLMNVYSEAKDWGRLVEVVLRIAELVDEPRQLAKYYITAASIAHEELGRVDEAVDYYEQALEHDPGFDKAFQGLSDALGKTQSWERLASAYHAQLRRLENVATPERRAELWDELGALYQKQLGRTTEAVQAYEAAQRLDPENRPRTEMLAEVYARDPVRYLSQAVQVHGQLLHRSPYRIESYQALRRIYAENGRRDEEWCLAQTLRVLGMADADEESLFKKHRSGSPAEAQAFFNEDIWFNHIVHPDQDPLLSGIFAVVTPAVIATKSQPLSAFQVANKDKRDAENDAAVMAQTLHYVAAVMRIALPDVYYRESDPGGLSILFTEPPAVGLGKAALAGGPPQALAFVAARHLSYFRPGSYLRHLVPTGSGLRAWLLAAIKTVTPQFPVPASLSAQVGDYLGALKNSIGAADQERLRTLVQKLLAAAPELDMKKWVAAVDLTADRVGFALANDLEIATALIKASPEDAATLPQKERLKELYLYSVSEPYLQLREKLGISIA